MTMSTVLENEFVWKTFFPLRDPSIQERLELDVLEWYSDGSTPPQRLDPPLKTAKDLIDRDEDEAVNCSLRIVFLPRDPPDVPEDAAFEAIYRHFAFPSCWLTERLRHVTHSFGAQENVRNSGVDIAWLRLLCKDVQIQRAFKKGKLQFYKVVDDEKDEDSGGGPGGSQDSYPWWHLDAFMHTRTRQGGTKCVTLFVFRQSDETTRRFEHLLRCNEWMDAVNEPYLLFSILLEQWYSTLTSVSWHLRDVFRPIEISTVLRSNRRQIKKFDDDIIELDFAGLHNLSKHCTYLLEAAEAVLLAIDAMTTHHRFLHTTNATALSNATAASLTYRKTSFQSTQLQLRSLEKRMSNTISLAFNLVTQEDSRTMKIDSNAMKAIAVLTLIFLPLTGIGSVFSTPFFDVDFDSERRRLQVARSIWIFWVIVIPLTGILLGSWLVWYHGTKGKRTGRATKDVGEPERTSKFHIMARRIEKEAGFELRALSSWFRRPRKDMTASSSHDTI